MRGRMREEGMKEGIEEVTYDLLDLDWNALPL
jgi:hypothetical protein